MGKDGQKRLIDVAAGRIAADLVITGVSCKEGEVEASVFERYRIPLYKEASFKPYIIAAMIFLAKFSDPAAKLAELVEADTKRIK